MRYQSRRIAVILLLCALLLLPFAIPAGIPYSFSFGNTQLQGLTSPPTIDVSIFGQRIVKSFATRYGLDLAGGMELVLEADMSDVADIDREPALEAAQQVIERRVNFLGVSEAAVQTVRSGDAYRLRVELPGIQSRDEARVLLGRTATLEFRTFTEAAFATDSATPSSIFAVTNPTSLTGKDIQKASVVYDPTSGAPQVGITFTSEGATKFESLTRETVGSLLPIFLDEEIISSPQVSQTISGGQAVIAGQFTFDDARRLVSQLNAGALPVPIKIVEERSIEARLGQEALAQSIRAGIIGLLSVVAIMVLLYGQLGLLSLVGLGSYAFITFVLYRSIPVTLTIPGIAGFILSIGMAVDSNILIFERYREERRTGKPWKVAIEHAFGKAWDSIRDANVTTLVTCAILANPTNLSYLPTSGLIRGFAITLALGVLTSLFTGLIVTRTVIRLAFRPRGKGAA